MFLQITGEWPTSDGEREFLFTMLLRQRGVRLRPGRPLREPGTPVFLEIALTLVERFLGAMLNEGFLIRADASGGLPPGMRQPLWAATANQLVTILQKHLLPGMKDLSFYPVSLWLLPRGDRQAEKDVELFQTLPHDGAVFEGAIESGAIRVSVSDAYCDIQGSIAVGAKVLSCLKAAAHSELPFDIDWLVDPGEPSSEDLR